MEINVEKTKYLCTGKEVTPTDLENGEEIHVWQEYSI
jgi:hypothetical protein